MKGERLQEQLNKLRVEIEADQSSQIKCYKYRIECETNDDEGEIDDMSFEGAFIRVKAHARQTSEFTQTNWYITMIEQI